MNFKDVKPLSAKGKDPYRYPNINEKIENQSKAYFKKEMGLMTVDITKSLVEIFNKNKK